ncbi:hypothetical protein WISP_16867 [Willisornis vidua]|uniref:Rho-GAP domain-containing protein n=1 Tax=Willisornis vidua TaxID=1566151 RepID=A0ABQ9DVY3_9PASS|nr:hypothetical protein WISP_16867 [Willisornis vidua]
MHTDQGKEFDDTVSKGGGCADPRAFIKQLSSSDSYSQCHPVILWDEGLSPDIGASSARPSALPDKMVFRKPPDGGWGWVVVLVSFFTQFLCYGSPLAVGVLYLEWLDVFGEGKGKTAWVGSLANGIGLLASPVCSICVSSFGARPVAIFSGFMVAGGLMMSSFAPNIYFLYVSYGIVVGLGCGLLYTATVTITCQYFDKRRGLALGLISTGSSVGLFIYAALQRELIELYGLDGCLLIVGALSLNILACGSLMRPLESSSSPPPEKTCADKVPDQYFVYHEKGKTVEENISILEKGYIDEKCENNVPDCKQDSILNKNVLSSINVNEKDTYKKKVVEQTNFCKQLAKRKWQLYLTYWKETVVLFKNKVFSALFVAILLFDIGGFPPSLLMEDVARSANINEDDYYMPLISIIGIMTTVGKLVLGILADFKWVNTLYLYVTTLLMTGVALFAIPFAKSYLTLAMLSGILGFLTGNWSIFPYVTTKTVGIEKLTHAYGILMFFAGLGNSLGPPIVGLERVGIFRIGGSVNKIKELKQKYNQGEKVDLINDGDVDSVASLLKLFLKELPVAVFPEDICSGLLKTFQEHKINTTECIENLRQLLSCLPKAHQNLLQFLSAFLLKVATYSAVNFMTLENLSIVFGPALFKVPVSPLVCEEQRLYNGLLLYLLQHHEMLFVDLNPCFSQRQIDGLQGNNTEDAERDRLLLLSASSHLNNSGPVSLLDNHELSIQDNSFNTTALAEDDDNKENYPDNAAVLEERQLRLQDTQKHKQQAVIDYALKPEMGNLKLRKPKPIAKLENGKSHEESQELDCALPGLSEWQGKAGSSASDCARNVALRCQEAVVRFQPSGIGIAQDI